MYVSQVRIQPSAEAFQVFEQTASIDHRTATPITEG
jgi:hypothetical protein